MKLAADIAIAKQLKNPDREHIIPGALDKKVAKAVAKAVYKVAMKQKSIASLAAAEPSGPEI
jgi:malic enzyme